MPCISIKTNKVILAIEEKQIKQRLGEAISILPGKSEKWLMCLFEGNDHIWLGGTDAPAAYVETALYGAASATDYNRLTEKVTGILVDTLGIEPARIYIKYCETQYWGWNGKNL